MGPGPGRLRARGSVAYLVNWRLSERQAIEISRLVSRLEGLARTDPLTGVPNRRVWEEELPRELDRARRLGTAVPGHDRPGRLQVLRRPPRPPGRRPRPQEGGLRLAGRDPLHRPAGPLPRGGVRAPAPGVRTRRRGPDRRAAPAGHPLVTCSVGLACWDFQEGAAELVERADQALHAAKAEGRNRYVLA
ncbi:MAG TPA: diguanylate cyclase [Actinomycetota bacterium]|nr:diguanylate cyclase [Actinomycetota bacterium]